MVCKIINILQIAFLVCAYLQQLKQENVIHTNIISKSLNNWHLFQDPLAVLSCRNSAIDLTQTHQCIRSNSKKYRRMPAPKSTSHTKIFICPKHCWIQWVLCLCGMKESISSTAVTLINVYYQMPVVRSLKQWQCHDGL